MTIDVSAVLRELGGRMAVEGKVELPEVDFLGERYEFSEPIEIKGSISNNGKSLIFKADCAARVKTRCGRCMKEIIVDVDFPIDENLVRGIEGEAADEGVIVFEGTSFDADEIILDDFLMNVNSCYLCREDCRGLCPKCGKDLNEGECGCSDEETDPRWSGLLDIMKNEN